MLIGNDWGGPVQSTSIGNGPWVMKKPERLVTGGKQGNGQCVAIAQAPLQMPHTSFWREGGKVVGNSSIVTGAVIATFINGRYPSLAYGNHVAIYIEHGKDDFGDYIKVIDQWTGRPSGYRKIYGKEAMTDRSNNANAFAVVYTLSPPPPARRRGSGARTRAGRRR